MDRWLGKTAVVTGASSGIGAAVLQQLAKNGVNVVGLARRHQRVQEMAERLKGEKGKVYALRADVTKEDEVVAAFEWIRKNLGGVDILINNAGVTYKTNITDGEVQHWRMMFELNVIALGTCTREALKSMKSRNMDDGHIINVCR
ncbi:hypothetical protein LSTR_LSTR004684 [Laodelphax striatellus]|uniref:Uncharacterized protein n=1 Tax=Laodelphax striatellus TaxID=195883 RepID=A0A482WUL9_LAOST|nr:hypothetical protein LSTR_LSTR004684 [Laodelphax striatellus]